MIVNDRRHMASIIDDRMNQSPRLASAVAGSGGTPTHVKTYMVEAAHAEDSSHARTTKFVESIFRRGDAGKVEIHVSSGDTVASLQTALKSELLTVYVDFTNPRFWLMHSLGTSDLVDRVVRGWTDAIPELDRAWMPMSLMEKCIKLGDFKGFSYDFNGKWLKNSLFGMESDHRGDAVSLQVHSRLARMWLDVTREGGTRHQTPLSKVIISSAAKTRNDIKYDGKITTKGKSFSDHIGLVNQIYDLYASKVRDLERDYSIRLDRGAGYISGEPIIFSLVKPIEDFDRFRNLMFAGTEPFRLSGYPFSMGGDWYSIDAIDLHTGHSITFEMSPTMIRMYLPEGTCGNTVLRFFTNLQHGYDALLIATNCSGEDLFAF